MMNLVYIALAIAAVVYLVVPAFRQQVNTLISTVWYGLYGLFVSPIARQKAAYRRAVTLMTKQRGSVAQLMAKARTTQTELATRKTALQEARGKYADAVKLGMDEAAKNKFALEVAAAEGKVTQQEGVVRSAQKAADSAAATLEKVKKNVADFADTVQTNEGKLELAAANNIATEALQVSQSINDALSEAGEATAQVDATLALSEANLELAQGDATDNELETRRAAAAAATVRARLDAELAGQNSAPAVAPPGAPTVEAKPAA